MRSILRIIFWPIQAIFFYPLLMLRGVFLWGTKILSFLSLAALVMTFFITRNIEHAVYIIIGWFVLVLTARFYDRLLFFLDPNKPVPPPGM